MSGYSGGFDKGFPTQVEDRRTSFQSQAVELLIASEDPCSCLVFERHAQKYGISAVSFKAIEGVLQCLDEMQMMQMPKDQPLCIVLGVSTWLEPMLQHCRREDVFLIDAVAVTAFSKPIEGDVKLMASCTSAEFEDSLKKWPLKIQCPSRERQGQIAMAEAEAIAPGAPGGAPGGAPVVPIFICSMAMPAVACPLHIFEPRYRLMMRRCIDSGQRQFGMCLFPGAQFGTMLYIKSFKQLPDGRSQIKTIGTRRFEVLEWGEKDGYATGRVRWVEDTKAATDNTEGPPEPTTAAVRLRKAVDSLLRKVPAQDRAALEEQLGPIPCTDGSDGPNCPDFVFWCMGLADLPPRICYELCFGASFREDPEKRLTTMLEIYEKKMCAKRDDQADQTE
eukprot:s758_g12.t1